MNHHPDLRAVKSLPYIRYTQPPTPFFRDLQKRVNQYFKDRNISRYGGWRMHFKTVFLFAVWVASYGLIMSDHFQGIGLIALQIVFHFTMFLMSVGIAHDASHFAYSKSKTINQTMNRVFDLVGINTYFWEFNHVKSHHNAPNIPIYDSAIDSFVLFRFHPRAAYRSFHRFQHIYIAIIYSLATLFKLLFLDFFSLRRRRIGFIVIKKHPPGEVLYFLITRLLVITYTIVLPLLLLSAPAWQILTGFFLGHVLSGLSLGAIFQVTHIADESAWPEPDENGKIHNSFDQHILATTTDFCPDSFVVTWIAGGLNLHVAHHLFPDICQTHLRAVTRILRQTAEDYGVNYRMYPSVGKAVRSHLYALKQLGDPSLIPQEPVKFI